MIIGGGHIGTNVTALDPSSVASEVWYGKESGNYTNKQTGMSMVYRQLYPYEGLLNYTSGIIHHVRLEGMHLNFSFKCQLKGSIFSDFELF